MPLYYFHIRDGDDVARDLEGVEFATPELAHEEAILAARELLSQRTLRGDASNAQAFEITDEHGAVIDVVPFKDVMRIS
jgi:hypothetical protein